MAGAGRARRATTADVEPTAGILARRRKPDIIAAAGLLARPIVRHPQ